MKHNDSEESVNKLTVGELHISAALNPGAVERAGKREEGGEEKGGRVGLLMCRVSLPLHSIAAFFCVLPWLHVPAMLHNHLHPGF